MTKREERATYTNSKPYYEKTFERHAKDLERVARGDAPHLRFNERVGKLYIIIIQQLRHYKGPLAGERIMLEPWQVKNIVIMMGWEKRSTTGKWVRRFNKALFMVPRKNGKTLILSGLSIADTLIRGEQGGEVVFFAAKRDQANIAHHGVLKMAEKVKELEDQMHVAYSTITFTKNDTTFKTLGRDSKAEDGANYSFGGCDELHQHPDDSLMNSVETSMGAREQPFMLIVTTAGFSLSSPLIPEYDYAKRVLDGALEDDNYFAFIAEAPADADPFAEETWRMANPNYGVSISKDFMKKQAKEAKERPEKYNNFLVKHLNRFVAQDELYVAFDRWKKCEAVRDTSEAIRVYLGLDLSLNDDFTAKATLYEFNDGSFHAEVKCYVPQETLLIQERILKAPLTKWVREGHLVTTPGDTIDLDYLLRDIKEQLTEQNIFQIGYDPHRAKNIVKQIEDDGYKDCVMISQGFTSISEPTALFLSLVKKEKLTYTKNPVLDWMVSNMSVIQNSYGNIKPDKTNPIKKIDGVAAIINTLWLMIMQREVVIDIDGMVG